MPWHAIALMAKGALELREKNWKLIRVTAWSDLRARANCYASLVKPEDLLHFTEDAMVSWPGR